jgi:D-amino peptidase
MNIFIEVDMEGISGITLSEQVRRSEARYVEAVKLMAADANACVDGCFSGGATKVTVWDAHGTGCNMPWERIDPRAELIQGGSDHGRLHDIGRYDALILLGFHAMAGTRSAVLEHTMSSASWQNCWINGRKAGEFAIDAGIAGDAGVPVIMTSGDDKLCAEARSWVKGIYTAQVKVGYACQGARMLSMEAAHRLIRETAAKACRNLSKIKPLVHRKPVRMRLEKVKRGGVPSTAARKPWLKIIDGRTYEVTGSSALEAFSRLHH